MKNQRGFNEVLYSVILFLIVLFFAAIYDYMSCKAKTESFINRWGPLVGCQINYKDKWINWDNYRGSGE